jgi:hypothetical protein
VGRSIALGAVIAITVLGSISASGAPTVDERELLGQSYEGRPIRVFHRGDPDEIRVLVVGCIHGDECAGVRIARRLRSGRPRSSLDRLHGTATSWQKHVLRGTEAFVVELPGGALRPPRARRFANAVYRLVRA